MHQSPGSVFASQLRKEVMWMQPATEIHSIQAAKWVGFLLCFPLLAIPTENDAKQVF